jgi:hypothetical protein
MKNILNISTYEEMKNEYITGDCRTLRGEERIGELCISL